MEWWNGGVMERVGWVKADQCVSTMPGQKISQVPQTSNHRKPSGGPPETGIQGRKRRIARTAHVETNVQNRPARCDVGGSGTRILVGRRSPYPGVPSLGTGQILSAIDAFPCWFALAHPTAYLQLEAQTSCHIILPLIILQNE